MYTRGVITDEISQDLETVIAVMRKYRATGSEIRTIWNTRVDQLSDEQVTTLRRRLDDEGMSTPALATPFFKCDLGNPDEYAEHLEILRRSIGIAHRLGTRFIRVFTFWRKAPLSGWDQILAAYQEPIDIAAKGDVLLCIENEPACYVGTGAELGVVIRALSSPVVRGVWDPGNTVAEPGYPDGYAHVRGLCPHVHLKDLKVQPDGSAVAVKVGDGDLDIRGQLLALRRDGYNGCVSLETHWRPRQLTPDALRLPGGAPFSTSGEEATSLCFERWDEIEKGLEA
jgi:sugar phosphate isomerase/epimerase